MFPKPDRSNYTPRRTRTPEDPSVDVGWNEDLFSDGRPYRVECWAEEGITYLTFFFSTRGMENYSNSQFAEFLERERMVSFLDGKPRVSGLPLSDASGNDMWSVTVVVGIDHEVYVDDRVRLRSYWPRLVTPGQSALRLVVEAYPTGSITPMLREHALELLADGSSASVLAPADRMLGAEEVASLLNTTLRWVYAHADKLGGKHLSRRCLRFPESAIRRRLERSQ